MVYFYYKLALPTNGSNTDVIERLSNEPNAIEQSLDPSHEPTAKLSEQSSGSFARFMEGDGTDVKARE